MVKLLPCLYRDTPSTAKQNRNLTKYTRTQVYKQLTPRMLPWSSHPLPPAAAPRPSLPPPAAATPREQQSWQAFPRNRHPDPSLPHRHPPPPPPPPAWSASCLLARPEPWGLALSSAANWRRRQQRQYPAGASPSRLPQRGPEGPGLRQAARPIQTASRRLGSCRDKKKRGGRGKGEGGGGDGGGGARGGVMTLQPAAVRFHFQTDVK